MAAGQIDDVIAKVKANGWTHAPITDTASTFGFVPWAKACKKAGLTPIYGVELAVSQSPAASKPVSDSYTFLSIDNITIVNRLMGVATNQFRYQPLLSLDQANAARDVIKILGKRSPLQDVVKDDWTYLACSPSSNHAYLREALRMGFRLIACSDNKYVNESDFAFYETLCGRNAATQTYPQHILSDDEWLSFMHDELDMPTATLEAALRVREAVFASCHAQITKGTLVVPPKPQSLRDMCVDGADKLGIDLTDPIYSERLERELALIDEKSFADYFHIVADMVAWARERMTVGPGRGSCCGSLVCYLTGITTVDPIVHDLMLERFISVDRSDMPDIDIDFPPSKRDLVFEYLDQVYGRERVARLGSVALFKADSAMNETCGALKIPLNDSIPVKESVEKFVMNDARGLVALADALRDTPQGRAFLWKYPHASIATRIEGHPRHAGTHAAGILISDLPIVNYVSTDNRIGTVQIDKGMAEELNLLKIDVLGVKQLDVFESALRMAGLPHMYLDKVPLDDMSAFNILNERKYTGVFQFNGPALQRIADGIKFDNIEDIIAATALARPGPMQGGATEAWIKRKSKKEETTYWHDCFKEYLSKTLGVIVYQEQILSICRNIGHMEWEEVTAVRQGMAKSKGSEYLRPYGEKFKKGCEEQGLESNFADKLWNDICGFGSYAFNRSHSVAYGLISYYCCWLKAHYPLQYMAATLNFEKDAEKQIALLKELSTEGIHYTPFDALKSTDVWTVIKEGGVARLIGPLSGVKGLGPKMQRDIVEARARGEAIPARAAKLLLSGHTDIDSLTPIADRIQEVLPDPTVKNIYSQPAKISDILTGVHDRGGDVMVFVCIHKITKKDENSKEAVERRNGRLLDGNTQSLMLVVKDDDGQTYAKIGVDDFATIGNDLLSNVKVGKSLYAIKGKIWRREDFRMIIVKLIRYIGELT